MTTEPTRPDSSYAELLAAFSEMKDIADDHERMVDGLTDTEAYFKITEVLGRLAVGED